MDMHRLPFPCIPLSSHLVAGCAAGLIPRRKIFRRVAVRVPHPLEPREACSVAQRALLSQGYQVTELRPNSIQGLQAVPAGCQLSHGAERHARLPADSCRYRGLCQRAADALRAQASSASASVSVARHGLDFTCPGCPIRNLWSRSARNRRRRADFTAACFSSSKRWKSRLVVNHADSAISARPHPRALCRASPP